MQAVDARHGDPVPWKATLTAWLYQPFASGPRAGVGDTLGAVASYGNERVFGAETLPGSVGAGATLPLPRAESGPEYVRLVHEAMPEVASVPVSVTPTGAVVPAVVSGPRCAVMAVAVGGVASRSIGTYNVVLWDEPFGMTSQRG